jgi:hypothetical protein
MAQISRPFQVVLAAFVLFAIAWFALLHRPGASSSGSSAPASVGRPVAPHPHAPAHARTTSIAHRTTSVNHATPSGASTAHHSSVTHVSSNGVSTRHHSSVTHTSSSGASTHHQSSVTVHRSSTTSTASHTAAPGASHKAAVDPRRTQPARHAPAATAKSPAAPAMQAAVAAELKQGKVVLLLFWNPSSSNDAAVHKQVQIVERKLGHRLAVHTASASQVSSFGSITRDIQIYQTPTLLVVNPHAQVTTVTGYTEAYALEQTIREARG